MKWSDLYLAFGIAVLASGLYYIVSQHPDSLKPGPSIIISKVEKDGHTYVLFSDTIKFGAPTVVHDPDCKCHGGSK